MGHDRLRARLLAQRQTVASARWIERLSAGLSEAIGAQPAMPDSFKSKVTRLVGPAEGDGYYAMRLGPKELVGRDTSYGDMRGTIARFLRDYPRFRNRVPAKMVKQEGYVKLLRKSRFDPQIYAYKYVGQWVKVFPDKKEAWWNLPPAGKRKLAEERLLGKYGGEKAAAAGLIPYFYGHDKSLLAWDASGRAAGLDNAAMWVKRGVERWRGRERVKVMAEWRAQMGVR